MIIDGEQLATEYPQPWHDGYDSVIESVKSGKITEDVIGDLRLHELGVSSHMTDTAVAPICIDSLRRIKGLHPEYVGLTDAVRFAEGARTAVAKLRELNSVEEII